LFWDVSYLHIKHTSTFTSESLPLTLCRTSDSWRLGTQTGNSDKFSD
jgi:hypothetical protein